MKKTYTVNTPADFKIIIQDLLLANKKQSLVLALQGDLGAGKTTFTQQLAKQLGVVESVTSPTFTIMKMYKLKHEQFDQLVHIDAYRLEDESEAAPLRLNETMTTPRTITCLEWPEQIPAAVPTDAIKVLININADETRMVSVTAE